MNKKGWLKSLGLTFFSLFLVSCAPSSGGGGTLGKLSDLIAKVGALGMINNETAMIGFIRICVFILIFALLFEAATRLNIFTRKIAGVVALMLALISALFIPAQILAGISGTYAFIFSVILIATPLVGALWFIYGPLPRFVQGRILHLLRIAILFVALWALFWVRDLASKAI